MPLTNLKIRDLFTPDAKLTFLVGAGCSMDPPSCLPAGKPMMKAIINYVCADSEIEKILKLEDLRFEQLVEIVRDCLDKELKIIDYYGQCDKPNLQHFFLAEMIKNGHFVMTPNFDFLIEYALQQSGVPNEEILPVITKNDYHNYSDPIELLNKGKKTIYKVHGSTKNIISLENTRDSLVTTIQALGSNMEGENIFQVEPFKRPLFENISSGRSLVVVGYSGSDDFDIVPTLKILKNVRNIIWINYSEKVNIGEEEIHEIDANTNQTLDELDKVTRILLEIWKSNNADHVYRVYVNTTEMVKSLLKSKPKLSSKNFSINSRDWLENNLDVPSEMMKYSIPSTIYFDFGKYNDAMYCSEKILQFAKKSQDKSWEAFALNSIGEIFREQGNYTEALKRYEEALPINEQLRDMNGKATCLNNIGLTYKVQGNYPEALKRYEMSLKIFEQLGDMSGKATCLNNIATIHYAQGNYTETLKRFEMSLKIFEQLGGLSRKATCLSNIGLIYKVQGNYPKALNRYEEALQIDEQLGNMSGKATCLNNIGEVLREQGNYTEALKRYEEVLQITEKLGDLSKKAGSFNNIATIHYAQGNYTEALKRYNEALQITEQLEDLPGKAIYLNNIGGIYKAQGNYPKALKWFEEALQIAEELGNEHKKAIYLNNIGGIYKAQGNYLKALKWFEEALEIYTGIGLGDSLNTNTLKDKIKDTKNKLS